MPRFAPGESKTAVAPITVVPAGLSCKAELYLGPDEGTKVATSGLIPFISTGAVQNVLLPLDMPATEGTYHVYIDVYAEDYLVAAYQAIEDVDIGAAVGSITLYGVGFDVRGSWEWYAQWYYPEIGKWKVNVDDYTGHRGPYDPCTPPPDYPVGLGDLLIIVRQGSYEYGWTRHGPFGPFVVVKDGVYTLNIETGELREGGL